MNTKALFSCGGGSNLILGTGMENQMFILRTPATVKSFSHDTGIILHSATPKLMLLIKNYHILCKLGNGETHGGHHGGASDTPMMPL